MLLESCESWLSVDSVIGVLSLWGQKFSWSLVLFPAILSCTVSTNCLGIAGVLTIVAMESPTFEQASNTGQETRVLWPTKF